MKKSIWKAEGTCISLFFGDSTPLETLTISTNFRKWKNIFELRCAKDAYPHLRHLFIALLKKLKKSILLIFIMILNIWEFKMKILYGYAARDHLLTKLSKKIQYLKSRYIIPSLAIILNNNSRASLVYIANKQKICEKLHIKFKLFKLDQSSTAQEMLKLIHKLNNDKKINGLFVQLPISKKIPERIVIDAINPIKDVDCFHNYNVGKIWTTKNESNILSPCTPAGIIALFDYYQISLEGKNVVIVNRSNIVGKPLAALFLQKNATVTVCHSKTKRLKNICKKADIVITAIGQANYFDETYFRNNAIIVDVGINWDKNNKPCGNVNMLSLKKFHGYISPIPGGVGPLTVVMLINNLVNLTMIQNKIKEID